MKKLENFSNCLNVLKNADFDLADNNDIYRTGVIGQFNLTFELAWKALQEILKMHGADGAATGSPREILQLGYKLGFVDDATVWLLMLKKRNTSVHIYNEQRKIGKNKKARVLTRSQDFYKENKGGRYPWKIIILIYQVISE